MLIESKGAIPNTFMHAFKDIIRLTNENDQLRKITQKLAIEKEEQKKENNQLLNENHE
jgi:hypothetical protein